MDLIEIKGKINTAICYARVVEDEAIEQIRRMCDYPMTEGSRIRIISYVWFQRDGCGNSSLSRLLHTSIEDILVVDGDVVRLWGIIHDYRKSDCGFSMVLNRWYNDKASVMQ